METEQWAWCWDSADYYYNYVTLSETNRLKQMETTRPSWQFTSKFFNAIVEMSEIYHRR